MPTSLSFVGTPLNSRTSLIISVSYNHAGNFLKFPYSSSGFQFNLNLVK